jgi:hypothetical protein
MAKGGKQEVSSCTSEQGGGSELDASLLGCSGVVGLEFNLACFCTWSRDGDMLSGLNGSDPTLIHHPVQNYKMIQLFSCHTSFVPPYKIKNLWTN